jgi:uncharacterized protein
MKPTICTASGIEFDIRRPKPGTILLEDIAHALSHKSRFGGHCNPFYTVAQHSCWVCDLSGRAGAALDAALGLFHDAAEAYMCDMAAPHKQLFPEYVRIELALLRRIYRAFGIDYSGCSSDLKGPVVADYDDIAWRVERASFMPPADWWPAEDVACIPFSRVWEPVRARHEFLDRAHRLAAEGVITLNSENCRHA